MDQLFHWQWKALSLLGPLDLKCPLKTCGRSYHLLLGGSRIFKGWRLMGVSYITGDVSLKMIGGTQASSCLYFSYAS
jgi:hypothetical protein